jgi:hypothetical protein
MTKTAVSLLRTKPLHGKRMGHAAHHSSGFRNAAEKIAVFEKSVSGAKEPKNSGINKNGFRR